MLLLELLNFAIYRPINYTDLQLKIIPATNVNVSYHREISYNGKGAR